MAANLAGACDMRHFPLGQKTSEYDKFSWCFDFFSCPPKRAGNTVRKIESLASDMTSWRFVWHQTCVLCPEFEEKDIQKIEKRPNPPIQNTTTMSSPHLMALSALMLCVCEWALRVLTAHS